MLCQIERCCRYAELFGRRVVVDTNYTNAIHFRDKFSSYFVSQQFGLELELSDQDLDIADSFIFPHEVRGNIRANKFEFSKESMCYVDTTTRTPLTFNFSENYNEPALLHQTGGGGNLGISALRRVRLHDQIVDSLIERLRAISTPYISIHIRNTDYETDYVDIFKQLSLKEISVPLLVCTDDENVLLAARQIITNCKLISFSNLQTGPDKRIHFFNENTPAKQRNVDAIVDLLLLAISSHLIMLPLKANVEAPNGGYSGFSILANSLHQDRTTLHRLLGRHSHVIDLFSAAL